MELDRVIVRALRQLRGAEITANAGDVIDAPNGAELIAAGAAEAIEQPRQAVVVEAAVSAGPEEVAVEQRPRGRRGGRAPAEE